MKAKDLITDLEKIVAIHGNIEVIVIDPFGDLDLVEDESTIKSGHSDWTASFALAHYKHQHVDGTIEDVGMLIPHSDSVIIQAPE